MKTGQMKTASRSVNPVGNQSLKTMSKAGQQDMGKHCKMCSDKITVIG